MHEAFRDHCASLAPGIKWGEPRVKGDTVHIRGKLREGWARDGVAATIDVDHRPTTGATQVGVRFDDPTNDYQLSYKTLAQGLKPINELCRPDEGSYHICTQVPAVFWQEVADLMEVIVGINGSEPEGKAARHRLWEELVPLFYNTHEGLNYRIAGTNLMEQDHDTIRGEAITYPPMVGNSDLEAVRARFR